MRHFDQSGNIEIFELLRDRTLRRASEIFDVGGTENAGAFETITRVYDDTKPAGYATIDPDFAREMDERMFREVAEASQVSESRRRQQNATLAEQLFFIATIRFFNKPGY